MEDSWDFRLKGMEQFIVGNIAEETIKEIEKQSPGAIARHPDEVCAIIKQAVKRKADEHSAARVAERRRVTKAARDAEQAVKDAKEKEFEASIASLPPEKQMIQRMFFAPKFDGTPAANNNR